MWISQSFYKTDCEWFTKGGLTFFIYRTQQSAPFKCILEEFPFPFLLKRPAHQKKQSSKVWYQNMVPEWCIYIKANLKQPF